MCVEYKVYSGANATGEAVTSGWALTNADVDFIVKVGGPVRAVRAIRAFRSWHDTFAWLAGWDGMGFVVSPLTICAVPCPASPRFRSLVSHRSEGFQFGSLAVLLARADAWQVEAEGLKAGTQYSFQFSNCADGSNKSPIGKTRTAPGWKATDIPTQRLAVYSCSNYPK
jgi:hypothetical protein